MPSDSTDHSPALDALAQCREEIERVDDDVVALLARRMTLGKRIGELKRVAGVPIVDPTRETEVIRRIAAVAHAAGLPAEPVREIFWQVVAMSRRVQESE
jgi:chorismate mutase